MKNNIILFLFFSLIGFNRLATAQDIYDSISTLPTMERAPAFIKLAKSLFSSNFDLADEYSKKALLIATSNGQLLEMGLAHKYLGLTDYFRRNDTSAMEHYNKGLKIFNKIHQEAEIGNVLNNMAIIYSENADYEASIDYYEKSLAIREKQNDAEKIIASLTNIGNLYLYMDKYDKSMEYYNKGIETADLVFPERQFPTLFSGVAKIYAANGDMGKAGDYFVKAVNSAKESGKTTMIVENLVSIGNFYYSIGSTHKAITSFEEALKLTEDHDMQYRTGVIKLNIGNIYYQTKQYEMALELYESSLANTKKTDDVPGKIRGNINVALAKMKLGSMDKAKEGFLEAMDLAEKINEPEFLSMAANYLGKYYLKIKDFGNSEKYLIKALDTASANNILREVYMANYNLGLYWTELNGFEKSVPFFQSALTTAEKMQNVIFQKDASEGLWKSYEKLNKYNKAFAAFKTYNVMNDSLFNEEKQSQISAVEGRLKLHLKEGQIINQNKIIEQQQQILKQERRGKIYIIAVAALFISLLLLTLNRRKIKRDKEKAELLKQNLEVERDLLQLQMNPHFIFNAMNSIQAFIAVNDSLQAEIFLSKFANLMRYYLESSSKKWIGLSEEIEALKLNLELERLRTNEKFDYEFILDENIEVEEIVIPPILLQPFVENSVKHGIRPMKSGGFIKIGFEHKKDHLFCYIEDNGVGRERAGKYKSRDSKHVSKGVEITKNRLKPFFPEKGTQIIINTIDLKNENGLALGTRVELLIPIKYY